MSEAQRLQAVKIALVQTTGTQGWSYVRQIAENVCNRMAAQAIDEEDSAKGEILRLKAQALKNGFRDVFSVIEGAKAFDPDTSEDEWFQDLSYESNEVETE